MFANDVPVLIDIHVLAVIDNWLYSNVMEYDLHSVHPELMFFEMLVNKTAYPVFCRRYPWRRIKGMRYPIHGGHRA